MLPREGTVCPDSYVSWANTVKSDTVVTLLNSCTSHDDDLLKSTPHLMLILPFSCKSHSAGSATPSP